MVYVASNTGYSIQPMLLDSAPEVDVYFGGKMVARGPYSPQSNGLAKVVMDRLGSTVRTFPYGDEKPAPTGGDGFKFATYWREAATNLDYGINRYYASGWGRFLSADHYKVVSTILCKPCSQVHDR